MNRRGFTLVELLAVIIILSLLTLLTSTAVTKLVKDAKDDLSSTQIELIKSAAQTWGAENLTGLPEAGKCSYLTVENLKNYGLLDSNLKIPNSNEDINEIQIKISTELNEKSGKLITTYEVNPKPESVEGCYKQVYNNGDVVYYNVEDGVGCAEGDYREDNSITGYNGYINKDSYYIETEKLGTQTSCLKFYAFLDDGSKKINLLLDHDVSNAVWKIEHSDIDISEESRSMLFELYNSTKDWAVSNISKNYSFDRSEVNGKNYEIEYTKIPDYEGATEPFKSRLIEAQEIARITGADVALNWNETNPNSYFEEYKLYYLDGGSGTDKTWQTKVANDTNKSKFDWLFNRTNYCTIHGCTIDGCTIENSSFASSFYGYWTSTYAFSSTSSNGTSIQPYYWIISARGKVEPWSLNENAAIRPVIEVLKSSL